MKSKIHEHINDFKKVMIKTIKLATLFLPLVFLYSATAPSVPGGKEVPTIEVTGNTKTISRMVKLGLAQITVNYKLTNTISAVGREKGTGKMAGAKLTSFLETTDGDLTEADFQEVTDNFNSYFQKKLKENGIDTVAWSTITQTDFYKKAADDEVKQKEREEKGGDVWMSCNAHKGNKLWNGKLVFAMGKIKKASRFADDMGAPGGYFHLTVDFADMEVGVAINTGGGMYTTITTSDYSASVRPNMKVAPSDLGNSMLWNDKDAATNLILRKDIPSGVTFHTSVSQDPSRVKNKAFAFAKTMNPVVIETTRAQYKAAALVALQKYADNFISTVVSMKKE